MAKGSDTKMIIIRRFNLLVSHPCLYICVGQYTIVMVRLQHKSITTKKFYIVCLQYFLYRYINTHSQCADDNSFIAVLLMGLL